MSHTQRYDEISAMALGNDDILHLGKLADGRRRQMNPSDSHQQSAHINFTNICRNRCRFCRFCRHRDDGDAYTLTPDDILARAHNAVAAGARLLHIVGGIHPDLPYAYYRDILRTLRQAFPDIHLRAFTATEIIDIAAKGSKTIEAALADLIDAGLNSLPGGGAEILDDDYFTRHAPGKPGPAAWLGVHATAHRLGIATNATMLFGFGETPRQRISHLLKLRTLQDESLSAGRGAFTAFVPLPWIDAEGKMPGGRREGFLELKTFAISRLVLDNIPHIKAFTPLLGTNLAQTALRFGADEIEAPLADYQIV